MIPRRQEKKWLFIPVAGNRDDTQVWQNIRHRTPARRKASMILMSDALFCWSGVSPAVFKRAAALVVMIGCCSAGGAYASPSHSPRLLAQTSATTSKATAGGKPATGAKTVTTSKTTTSTAKGKATVAATGKPTLLEFSAPYCVPCKKFAPTFEKMKQAYTGKADFQTVDIEDPKSQALVDKYKIVSVPKLIIINAAGKIKYEHDGMLDEKTLTDEVNKVLGSGK
jgi:thioredoxin 1